MGWGVGGRHSVGPPGRAAWGIRRCREEGRTNRATVEMQGGMRRQCVCWEGGGSGQKISPLA